MSGVGVMMRLLSIALVAGAILTTQAHAAADDLSRLKARAAKIEIVRDDWGIAHIHGKTDADAVFGMAYTQAEDDFNRVETNYITALGRTAEADGETAIWSDLRQKLFIDPQVPEGRLRQEPRLAEGADERLGRRPELLPGHPSQREAAHYHQVRAVDGAELQRRQHRRRYRAGV
jgi:acyl-homoserine lactone acylase PvdQ